MCESATRRCFDLDAKRGPAATDVARLRELLTRAGLPHVVCVSGPGDGRHVWAALAEPVTATPFVAGIARDRTALYDPAPGKSPSALWAAAPRLRRDPSTATHSRSPVRLTRPTNVAAVAGRGPRACRHADDSLVPHRTHWCRDDLWSLWASPAAEEGDRSMATKRIRRASAQINIRLTPEEIAIIRAGIPRGDLTPVAVQLLLDEARARLANQPTLDLPNEGGRSAA